MKVAVDRVDEGCSGSGNLNFGMGHFFVSGMYVLRYDRTVKDYRAIILL